jgi:hypothetical protein
MSSWTLESSETSTTVAVQPGTVELNAYFSNTAHTATATLAMLMSMPR